MTLKSKNFQPRRIFLILKRRQRKLNEIKIFTNENFGEVGAVELEGNTWFIARDVCRALELDNSRQAISRLDEDEKNTVILNDGNRGNPNMAIINESGLYSLVLSSRKPEAKAFKRWITHEVLPSIRKHGMYAMDELLDNPDIAIEALTRLKEEREKRKCLECDVERMKPKEIFADSVASSHTSILIGELAKILKANGHETGQKRLFETLRQDGFLIKRKGSDFNMPTQKSMELGLMEIKETTINNADGSIRLNKTTKVTGKGQIYFVNRYCGSIERL